MRAHQASSCHHDCIDQQKGLLDKLAAQKKIDDYERADPEGARVTRLMRSIQFVYGFTEMVKAMCTYHQQQQLMYIHASPWIGISCDESTDRSRGKHLVVFATFMKERAVVTEFLAPLTIHKCDAGSLFVVLLSHLDNIGIDLQRIVAVSTDGAGVMVGSQSGLAVRLRQRVSHLCDSKDGLSLFDLTSGVSTAPTADADSTVRSQWLTRNAAARLAVRNHLPSTERAHLSQYKSARALYHAVVARYSSPATAALSRLMLPYPFPDLAAFATIADLVAHLRTSDARYRAALPAEFGAKNPPPCTSPFTTYGADLQDAWVDQFTPGGQRVTHCTCSRTGRHLATFTRRPGSSLYTLTTAPPPVSASGQVAASSQVFAAASRSSPASAPCSCRPLAHETLLWHHRLGHPSLPRLRGMASRALVSGLPRSLPPLPPGPAPTCVPCVEGRQRAAPHSSFPPTEAPLQTLHMDVWGLARVRGQGHKCYFLLVVDNYSRYTTVFPLRSKGEVTEVLINWIRGARRQISESFGSDLPVLRLHSDRGGEFSSDLLRAFCRLEGIRQTFTLPASPQQNGIAKRRIGMVMDVARTSMIHAAAPHFLWPFALLSAILPRTSCPPVPFPVSSLASLLMHPNKRFYHPASRRVLSSQDVTFDESVLYYRLFPYHTASPPPPLLFLAPSTPLLDPLPPQGPASSGVSQVDPAKPVEVAVASGAARGAAPDGTASGGAEPACAESGGALGVPSRREPLSPQRLRDWYSRRCRGGAGAPGGSAGATGALGGTGAAGGGAGAEAAGGAAGAGGCAAAGGSAGAGATGGAVAAGGGAAAGAAGGAVGTGDPVAD
ncbi:unnamed protein product [Closterium sp. NIES-54]